jgi:hypothetical protein
MADDRSSLPLLRKWPSVVVVVPIYAFGDGEWWSRAILILYAYIVTVVSDTHSDAITIGTRNPSTPRPSLHERKKKY